MFDQTYLEANPFDACGRAIVKIDDQGYSLIDDKGEKLTEKAYYRMEYIGSSYYAVYNEGGNTVINGGYFCGYNNMDDIYITGGTVTIFGGYFEDNKATLADGYTYQSNVQEIDGITYNYEVVLQL